MHRLLDRAFVVAIALTLAVAPVRAQVQSGQGVQSFNGRRGAVTLGGSDLPAIPSNKLPAPTGSTIGGVKALASSAHCFINQIDGTGTPSCVQPAAGDVFGLAPSATTDTTNPANIASTIGTVLRSVFSFMQENVTIRDFGAKCDGVTDDSNALVGMYSGTSHVVIPRNCTARVATATTINWHVDFMTGGVIKPDGVQVTIVGGVTASPTQLISTPVNGGTLIFTPGTQPIAYPEWFIMPSDPDSSAGIQRTFNAEGIQGWIQFNCHSYAVSSTLQAYYNQRISGCSENGTILVRTTDYGDTLRIGSPTAPSFAFIVENMWLQQSPVAYGSPMTALTNLVHSGAQVHFWGAQGYIIRDTWLSRGTYGIYAEGGTLGDIDHVNIIGYNDPVNSGAQESVAAIYLNASTTVGNPTSVYIHDSNLTGIGYPGRSKTFTASDGSHAVSGSYTQPVGPLFLIVMSGCEDCKVTQTYLGGGQIDNIHMAQQAGGALLDDQIEGNMFDSAGSGCDISVGNPTGTGYFMSVIGNTFNAEQTTLHAVCVTPSGDSTPVPSLQHLAMSGNVMSTYVGTPIMLSGAVDFAIGTNTVTAFNYYQTSAGADPNFASAVYAQALTQHGTIVGNQMRTSGTFTQVTDSTTQVSGVTTLTVGLNGK